MQARLAIAWTMMAAAALAGCATQRGLQVVVEPEPTSSAWWMRTTFVPHGDQVRGIPARRIDPTWCRADELTERAFPESVRSGPTGLEGYFGHGTSGFSSTGFFGGRSLEVVLGIFESCAGHAANFLLVLAADRPASSPEKIVQVETISTRPVVMYLTPAPAHDAIYVPSCFQCDHIGKWQWDPRRGRFVPQPEPEFD